MNSVSINGLAISFIIVLLAGAVWAETGSAPSPEWQGNTLGLEDNVLPPWTPLQLRRTKGGWWNRRPATRVSCWGRTYEFNEMGLPAQITAKNKAMLARQGYQMLRIGKNVIKSTSGIGK